MTAGCGFGTAWKFNSIELSSVGFAHYKSEDHLQNLDPNLGSILENPKSPQLLGSEVWAWLLLSGNGKESDEHSKKYFLFN